MARRVDYQSRAVMYMGAFKTQKAAAAHLGVATRTLRRYREGIRTPRRDLARRMNIKVQSKLRTHMPFAKQTVFFSDKTKAEGYTPVCIDEEALLDHIEQSNKIREEYIAKALERNVKKTSVKVKVFYVSQKVKKKK